jgi:hypothetical protein
MINSGFNPFYGVMPDWFLYIGIAIATTAAIIASQALISGSFTLISEAMRLNLWPKLKIQYPTEARGQQYIPAINMVLFVGCLGIVIYFKRHQYGGRVWIGNHLVYDCNFAAFRQLPGNEKIKINPCLFIPDCFLTIETSFPVCQYSKISSWRICCIDRWWFDYSW